MIIIINNNNIDIYQKIINYYNKYEKYHINYIKYL